MAADGQGPDADPTGEYVVDIAEYYGDAAPDAADKIVYRQLKHSTVRPDQPWTASGLKNTLEGFARRFSALSDIRDCLGLPENLEGQFCRQFAGARGGRGRQVRTGVAASRVPARWLCVPGVRLLRPGRLPAFQFRPGCR